MTRNTEQNPVGGVLSLEDYRCPLEFELDPPIASTTWLLLSGHVRLPDEPSRGAWWFGRRAAEPALDAVTLHACLPDETEPRPLELARDGSFESRIPTSLPRLRAAHRQIQLIVSYRGTRIDHSATLFTPSPGAALGVIVLTEADGMSTGSRPGGSTMGAPSIASPSECTHELSALLRGQGPVPESNPVFYLGSSAAVRAIGSKIQQRQWPEGLSIPIRRHDAISARAADEAAWIARLLDLYTGELEFVIVADTGRQSAATLRTLARQGTRLTSLQAVYLNDTRPVARGVMRQPEHPIEFDRLELPIVICRTIDDGRRAVVQASPAVSGQAVTVAAAHSTPRRIAAAHTRRTRYPLVFCHGMLGYSVLKFRRVRLENYFNGLRELLIDRGFHVLMPQLGKTHSIEQRADQLRRTIGRWTSEPVNIIAHSMGGLDARMLIAKHGMADRVVSLTTVATPHHGSYFADWFVEKFDASLPFLSSLEHLGLEVEGFRDCTRAACRAFNETVQDVPGVRYFSYSSFQVARKIPPMLRRSHSLIARVEGANDGLVSDKSARWGEHLASLRADHVALIGERGPEFFDHLAFYTRIVEDLIRMGF